MARKQISEADFRQRVISWLPKGIPAEAIYDVECDPYDGNNGGYSYWVYLANGYWNPTMGCHTIHEDTLAEIKAYVREIEVWEDDPALEDETQGYESTEATEIVKAAKAAKAETSAPETDPDWDAVSERVYAAVSDVFRKLEKAGIISDLEISDTRKAPK